MGRTGSSEAPLFGYCDRLSLRPGEQVTFRVGARSGDVPYRATIVRLRCADLQPDGPGFREEEVGCEIAGDHVAHFQRIDRGSRAVVPAAPALAGLRSFSAQAVVWPTRPGEGWQSIVASWDDADRVGFALCLDERGAPTLRVGDGAGSRVELSTSAPLRPRQWVRITAVYDAERGRARLVQEPRPEGAGESLVSQPRSVERTVARVSLPDAPRPLVFAAWRAGGDARGPCHAAHFDGKIEAPRLVKTALRSGELDALAAPCPGADLADSVVGWWDFSLGMASRTIRDRSGNGLDGQLQNLPVRALTGIRWDGSEYDWRRAPEQYGAIHFHADDLYDAGWEDAFGLTIPSDWRSGIYAARLRSETAVDYVPFFVCPAKGRSDAKLALLLPTATYLAYANLPDPHTFSAFVSGEPVELPAELMRAADDFGGSCYQRHDDDSGIHHSSHLRPVLTLKPRQDLWGFNADTLIVDWLEASGFDYDLITDHLLHEEGEELLEPYRVVVTGSHPEYYSTRMLDALEAHLGRGGRLAYLGGNGFYWRIGFSQEWPAAIEVRRAEDGTRTWESQPGEYYQAWGGELGGLWRRIGRPPNRLVGIGFAAQGFRQASPYQRRTAAPDARATFVFDGVEAREIGDFGRLGGAAGEEIDRHEPRLGSPPHALVLASAEDFGPDMLKTKEEFLASVPHDPADPQIRADMVFFETPNGGAVFSTGSIAWAGSLAHHNYRNDVSRITRNVLQRFLDPAPFPEPPDDTATGWIRGPCAPTRT